MKTSSNLIACLYFTMCLLVVSCGTSKKITVLDATVDRLAKDTATLHYQLKDLNSQVKILSQEKVSLQYEYNTIKSDLEVLSNQSKLTIADQAKRLKNMVTLIKMQNDAMAKLLNTIMDALMNFKTDELNVYLKDGNVYVSLEEKLLFKSGSDEVNPKGKEVLKSLSVILNKTNDITVMVEGHTDNVPIKTQLFKDNWDLSTARAISILRILIKECGFDPNRITASGRGEFHPIKPNDTVEGRAANRRTEIILSPDLKDLESLLYL